MFSKIFTGICLTSGAYWSLKTYSQTGDIKRSSRVFLMNSVPASIVSLFMAPRSTYLLITPPSHNPFYVYSYSPEKEFVNSNAVLILDNPKTTKGPTGEKD
jgi:hypothetical protein